MSDTRTLDQKIEDDYINKLKAMREAERQKNEYGSATRGGGAANDEARRRNAEYEKARKEYEMAQRVRNERNARNRGQ